MSKMMECSLIINLPYEWPRFMDSALHLLEVSVILCTSSGSLITNKVCLHAGTCVTTELHFLMASRKVG